MQRQPTILVVTSEPTLCVLLDEALREYGTNVVTVASVYDVGAVLPTVVPNLVFLDVPYVEDGLSLCRRQLQEYGLDVPIVLLSTASNVNVAPLPEGAASRLRMPFLLDDVLTCVSCWLGGSPGPCACPVGRDAVHCSKKQHIAA